MAATHHLDVSLTLDDIGWHFLNFGEAGFVRATEAGLRELGLSEMAEWFAEASAIVNSLRVEIAASDDFHECLEEHGQLNRINELTRRARSTGNKSLIYDAWIRYAREHPENVFGNPTSD